MTADDTLSPQKYELVKLSVASGTQIATRAADVVKNLRQASATGKPVVVSLSTRSRNANKLISIVEIAKRELKAQDVHVFQYNALSSEMIQIERQPKQCDGSAHAGADKIGEKSDGSGDAFETMGAETLEGTKQRLIPVMTTYLSTASIKELKAKLG